MIDKKYIELINKEIDGLNSQKDSAKLKEYLAKNSEAQNLYDDLVKLSHTLRRVNDFDPPPNLKKHILNSIKWNKYTFKEKRNFLIPPIPSIRFKFNFVYTFSAGLIVGIIIYSIFLNKILKTTSLDISHLTGTLIINDSSLKFETTEQLEINLKEGYGTLNIKNAENLVLAELYLTTQKQIEVVLEYAEQDMILNSLTHLNQKGIHANIGDNYIKINHTGDHKYIFIFKDKTSAITPISFKVFSDGTLLYEKTILTKRGGK